MLQAHGEIPGCTLVSPHFTFAELIHTDVRDFIEEQEAAPPQVRANLVRLCADLLEPARALVGPLRVNSAYRCLDLNTAIGGSRTSAHLDGLAADVFPLEMALPDAFERLAQSGIPFDQLIFEFRRWIHIGAAHHGQEPRLQRLAIYEPARYERWNPSDPRFRAA